MDEGDCANVQRRLVHLRRPRAVGLQALRNDPQENSQHPLADIVLGRVVVAPARHFVTASWWINYS